MDNNRTTIASKIESEQMVKTKDNEKEEESDSDTSSLSSSSSSWSSLSSSSSSAADIIDKAAERMKNIRSVSKSKGNEKDGSDPTYDQSNFESESGNEDENLGEVGDLKTEVKDMEDDTDKEQLRWIMEHIDELKDSEIGQYELKIAKFRSIIDKIVEMRGEYGHEEYEGRTKAMSEFAVDGTKLTEYSDFWGMYEFIIHIHKIYGVKLNKSMSDADNRVFVQTLGNVFSKYINHFESMQNIPLTQPPQFTTM